jgi:hypothetical protein
LQRDKGVFSWKRNSLKENCSQLILAAIGRCNGEEERGDQDAGWVYLDRRSLEMLGIARTTVDRYFARGILAGEQHPITNLRRISKASVFALMKKYGMQWKEQS